MPSNICIIEVNLGVDINDLISDDIKSLTARSQEDLDKALEAAKAAKLFRDNKIKHQQQIEDSINGVLETVYELLVVAGDDGMPVSACMAKVIPFIGTPAALTLRFKSYLDKKGNPFILDRKKIFGTQHYVLIPFNHETPESK